MCSANRTIEAWLDRIKSPVTPSNENLNHGVAHHPDICNGQLLDVAPAGPLPPTGTDGK